ncbi:uncharacterized protein LTR77_000453 [Saxophila tyrrhenica]|uniref:FAD/NAD(P)-binding domain-containing protein n=1 Tax=Saxophila tyrrhenica TaxID=1690608 RepID=A0AAV9PRC3_9PEZI|nr:hypothetical protein LTR77_000453 [Saxophila tyrrhenica]
MPIQSGLLHEDRRPNAVPGPKLMLYAEQASPITIKLLEPLQPVARKPEGSRASEGAASAVSAFHIGFVSATTQSAYQRLFLRAIITSIAGRGVFSDSYVQQPLRYPPACLSSLHNGPLHSSRTPPTPSPRFLLKRQPSNTTMPETRNIVFLGASYAGLSSAHYFLRHIYPRLPTDGNIKYRVLVVDPSSKWYARHGSPRAIVRPDLIPLDKIMLDIEPGFKQYGDKVHFIQAKATSWDEKARTVVVQKADGKTESIAYWALILATGTKTFSPLFSLQGNSHVEIERSLKSIHSKISSAKDITIIGGGPAGVETAGELGEYLNGAAGWFASSPSHPKAKITLITSASKLLPALRQSISDQAQVLLKRVGVEVRFNTKLYSSGDTADGRTKVMLHDGEELVSDIVIQAMGNQPLSGYVPEHLKDTKGYVVQNNQTLRVDAAGARVYAVGDVGTSSSDGIMDIMGQVPVMETNLKRDLLAAHANAYAKPKGKDRLFEKNTKETQLVPIGRSKGVGAILGWRLPSFFIWMIKGRDYMMGNAGDKISGMEVKKESVWKQEELFQ